MNRLCLFCQKEFKDTSRGKNKKFCCKNHQGQYRWLHYKDKLLAYNKQYEQENKSRIQARKNTYRRNRYANDINFRLSLKLRARVARTIKSNSNSLTDNFGCSIRELKIYLESKFLPGMSWSNYNKMGWHIDHIKSLSEYDLSSAEQINKACHYTNLIPRWAKDNHKKSCKTLITIVTGAPGAGKSWVAKQLNRAKWNVVDSDLVPKKQLKQMCISPLPTVLFLTVGVSTFMKDDTYHYDLIVIDETLDLLKSRVVLRGGTVTATIDRRHKRMQSLKKMAKMTGTSEEVLSYLA